MWSRNPDLKRLIVLATASTAMQAVRPTASYRTLELGGTAAAVGLVTASYAALAALAAVPCGRLIDKMGPRRFLLGGLITLLASYGLAVAAPTIPALAASQMLVGLGQISIVLAVQTITANLADRDRGFARLTVAAGLGQMVGPLMAGALLGISLPGLLGGRGTRLVFAVAGLMILAGLVLAASGVDGSRTTPSGVATGSRGAPLRKIVRGSGMPVALTTSVAMTVAVDLLIAYLPVMGELRGIGPGTIGLLLSLRALSALASRLVLPKLVGQLGRRQVLLAAMATSGVAMAAVGLAAHAWLLGALTVLIGFGLGIAPPMTMALVALEAPEGGRGTAMALRISSNRIGQVALPVAAAGLASVLGPASVFVFVAGTLLGGAAWVRGSAIGGATR